MSSRHHTPERSSQPRDERSPKQTPRQRIDARKPSLLPPFLTEEQIQAELLAQYPASPTLSSETSLSDVPSGLSLRSDGEGRVEEQSDTETDATLFIASSSEEEPDDEYEDDRRRSSTLPSTPNSALRVHEIETELGLSRAQGMQLYDLMRSSMHEAGLLGTMTFTREHYAQNQADLAPIFLKVTRALPLTLRATLDQRRIDALLFARAAIINRNEKHNAWMLRAGKVQKRADVTAASSTRSYLDEDGKEIDVGMRPGYAEGNDKGKERAEDEKREENYKYFDISKPEHEGRKRRMTMTPQVTSAVTSAKIKPVRQRGRGFVLAPTRCATHPYANVAMPQSRTSSTARVTPVRQEAQSSPSTSPATSSCSTTTTAGLSTASTASASIPTRTNAFLYLQPS